MSRYILFAGSSYYPKGGWNDFKGSFADLDSATALVAVNHFDWWHVVDKVNGEIVKRS